VQSNKLHSVHERWLPWIYGLLLFVVAWSSDFAVLSNDSFPLRWQAAHLSFHDASSFYNAFFPIGYPVILRTFEGFGNPFVPVVALQILASIGYARVLLRLSGRFLRSGAQIVASTFVLFSPLVVRGVLSAVPDFLLSLLVLLAFESYMSSTRDGDRKAGVFLGLGILLRFHGLAVVGGLTLAVLMLESAPISRLRDIYTGFLPFVIFQSVIQLLSGHGPFETGQAFNIWKTMHGIDWSHPPEAFSKHAWEVIREAPGMFVQSMATQISEIGLPLLALIGLIAAGRWSKLPTPSGLMVIGVTALAYLLLTLAGGSARAELVVLPVIVVAFFFLIQQILPPGVITPKLGGWITLAAVLSAFAVASIFLMEGVVKSTRRLASYTEVARILGLSSESQARQIYTDDFALYFPAQQAATPYSFGGWSRLGLPNFAREVPLIHDSTSEALSTSLKAAGIQWIVFLDPPLNGRGYQVTAGDTSRFQSVPYQTPIHSALTATSPSYRIFRVR
jgi:hypothetical protein